MTSVAFDDEVRLEDPAWYSGDPWPGYARLRREAPVYWSTTADGHGYWVLTKWADIRFVSEHPQRFVSGHGIGYRDRTQATDAMNDGAAPEGARLLVTLDNPKHRQVRKLVQWALTPKSVARLEAPTREYSIELLDAVPEGEPFDAADALAVPLPLWVISALLGIPRDDWRIHRRWVDCLVVGVAGPAETLTPEVLAGLGRTQQEMWDYFEGMLEERLREPKDDLISSLAAAELDGDRLDKPQQLVLAGDILGAGSETTGGLIAGGLEELARHPDQAQWLRENPSRIPQAVEEMIRWTTPIPSFGRVCVEETTIRDQVIKPGDFVFMIYEAANRDEEVWDRAGEFDVTRQPDPRHVAFGFGEHYCLGAALARMEGRIFFEEALKRFRSFEAAGPAQRMASAAVNRWDRLPMVFRT